MEIKYTTDGKKVVVIGNLNAQEKIVQEVFVSGETEIPSGENFVVKSLHDAPVKSWKQQELERVQKEYETIKPRLEKEMDEYKRKHKMAVENIRERIEYAGKLAKNVAPESFDLLCSLCCGEINWIVNDGRAMELISFEDFMKSNDYGIKLISLFGKDDGTLTYKQHSYSDGSGGGRAFVPFKTKEDALSYLQKQIDAKEIYYGNEIEFAKKNGLKLDPGKISVYKEKQVVEIEKSFEDNKRRASEILKKIEDIKNL